MKFTLQDCRLIELPNHARGSARLSVANLFEEFPWIIKRIFFIENKFPENRGDHAHKLCSQFFILNSGQIELICHDGKAEAHFFLKPLDQALLVPPGIWVKLVMNSQSSVTVLTDQFYDPEDYINEWSQFLRFKEIK